MLTLREIMHQKVESAWGDQIRQLHGYHYCVELQDYDIDRWIDDQSPSWILREISEAIEDLIASTRTCRKCFQIHQNADNKCPHCDYDSSPVTPAHHRA